MLLLGGIKGVWPAKKTCCTVLKGSPVEEELAKLEVMLETRPAKWKLKEK